MRQGGQRAARLSTRRQTTACLRVRGEVTHVRCIIKSKRSCFSPDRTTFLSGLTTLEPVCLTPSRFLILSDPAPYRKQMRLDYTGFICTSIILPSNQNANTVIGIHLMKETKQKKTSRGHLKSTFLIASMHFYWVFFRSKVGQGALWEQRKA